MSKRIYATTMRLREPIFMLLFTLAGATALTGIALSSALLSI